MPAKDFLVVHGGLCIRFSVLCAERQRIEQEYGPLKFQWPIPELAPDGAEDETDLYLEWAENEESRYEQAP